MATLDEFSILCIFSGAILLLVVILIKKEIVIDVRTLKSCLRTR